MIKRLVTSLLIAATVISINPIGASAEWKQDSNGWWNTEGSSYSKGWTAIDGKWYYFNSNGYMAHDTTIDGYILGTDGVWKNNTSSNYSNKIKKPITRLTNKEVSNLPDVKISNTMKSINSVNNINNELYLKEEYLDTNGNVVPASVTGSYKGQGWTNTLEISGKVDTVVYKDRNENVVFKARVKNNKLYYYDNNDKPLTNTIVNGQITDSDGAWVVGDTLKMMSQPTDGRTLDLHAYPDQLGEINLYVRSNSFVYNHETKESRSVQNITATLNNNVSDCNNNIGAITFVDDWSIYRLSDDGTEWIDVLSPLSEGNTESNNVSKYTIPYRGYYDFWFEEGNPWYDKAFSKSGTYLITCNGLGLADIVNIECK